MSELAIKTSSIKDTSSTSNLVQFPSKSSTVYGEYDAIINYIIGNPQFKDQIDGLVEASVVKKLATNTLNRSVDDNPFDSIYLSELMPDVLNKENIEKIKMLGNKIVDLSDQIEFNDGWDD